MFTLTFWGSILALVGIFGFVKGLLMDEEQGFMLMLVSGVIVAAAAGLLAAGN